MTLYRMFDRELSLLVNTGLVQLVIFLLACKSGQGGVCQVPTDHEITTNMWDNDGNFRVSN